MKFDKSTYHIISYFPSLLIGIAVIMCSGFLFSCTDENINISSGQESGKDGYKPWEDPEMLCLPIRIAFDDILSTRAEGDSEFTQGTDQEHKIDFDTENECYAIFFDENYKVKYIKPLYYSQQLGTGSTEPDKDDIEYSVTALAYLKKSDVQGDEDITGISLVRHVLVVLNGKPIYQKFYDKIYTGAKNEDGEDIAKNDVNSDSIMNMTWNNPANYSMNLGPMIGRQDKEGGDGRIGVHKDANNLDLFTMTNSAYYEGNQLKTLTKLLDNNFYSSLSEYQKDVEEGKATPATIYVERMVAKMMAPTFDTEVLGTDRVFRPDQNAQPVVVYSWDTKNNLVSAQQNWRIHLTGWTINGTESQSYIFKKIPSINWRNGFAGWNSEQRHRSYWSVDPHYNVTDTFNVDGVTTKYGRHFYPWQFRKAADRSDIISIQAGMAAGSDREFGVPVLRYNSYNDLYWAEEALYVHDNTFDPNVFHPEDDKYYDGRASILVGPHLLVTGELYLPKPGGEYMGEFGVYPDIYSDRMRRYYLTEADWVKMFVRDFNRALVAQERMAFPVYDWDGVSSGKANHSYIASPSGSCQLFLRQRAANFTNFDTSVTTLEQTENGVTYSLTPVTYTLIDNLLKESGVHISIITNARNGDGRLLPWVSKDGVNWMDFGLVVRNPEGNKLAFRETKEAENVTRYDWTYDMYMSLFHEWFGPVDHYKEGKLYYAGEIKHDPNNLDNNFYGIVRNHLYKFHVNSINGIGTPIDDLDQIIIPEKYAYNDMIMVYLEVIPYHQKSTVVDVP